MRRHLLFLLFSPITLWAQNSDAIDTALIPFWQGKKMYNESVLMISKNGALPEAPLLFKPKKIVSVKNAAQDITYVKGKDWDYKNGKLILLPGSDAIFMTERELYPDTTKKSFPKKGGGKILFAEGSFFHQKQLAVTYTHARNTWKGEVPSFKGEQLPNTLALLEKKKAIHILLYGDSIAAGANASGITGAAPGQPDWGSLVAEKWRRRYRAEVQFTNTAVGGMDSRWGRENAQKLVSDHHPDLVMIAFGMNDGTGKMAPEKFKANIDAIIKNARSNNPDTEFILIATMLPNPESLFVGTQSEFKKVLEELTGQGIILVDMTAVHRELLKHKTYQDMTGNNINHPNDFLIRWYAQEIAGVMEK